MQANTPHCYTVVLLICAFPFFSWAKSDHRIIHERVVQALMKYEVDDGVVDTLIRTIKQDGIWPGINYRDVSRTGFEHRFHLANMVSLARAYRNENSKFFKDGRLKKVLESALKHWVDHDYFCDNWWHNQIGTPNGLVTVMLIVGEDLPGDLVNKAQPIIGRADVNATGARPGGDRIKIAGIMAKNLLFLKDYQKFEEVIRVIEGEIKFVEAIGNKYGYGFASIQSGLGTKDHNGRGMQYDYSFHHRTDGVNNTLSYGLGYAEAFVEWAVYTAQTRYSFSPQKLELLVNYFLDGICKTAVYGKYPDAGAKNRSISRKGALKPYSAKIAERLLITTDYRKDELREIVDVRSHGTKPTISHATFFWQSEHFTFQRPEFFTSVRMYSSRVYNMEWPYNSEGLLNHHRGDGANHISVTGDEYYDIAPVFDYQKIPGTTTVQKPDLPPPEEIQKLGRTDFVGAVTDGTYGAVGFDFKSPHDPLVARKAWFFFDKEYVCLGAGISSKQDLPVVTTLNQSLLRDDVTISVGKQRSVIEQGEKGYENVNWVFHNGVAYLFPKAQKVNIKNDREAGSWWEINKQTDSPKDEVALDVFKLWFDHGNRPSDQSYAYIVVPAVSVNKLEQRLSQGNIKILSNTPGIQAVQHSGLQICQSVFYRTGEVRLSDGLKLICNSPGIVLIKTEGQRIREISVSDPNREQGTICLKVSTKIEKTGENFSATWREKEKMSEIMIDLPRGMHAGSSITIDLE